MAKNGQKIEKTSEVSNETLRNMIRNQKIANAAVQKAQAENRQLGIPNWYSINGEIISDIQIKERSKS